MQALTTFLSLSLFISLAHAHGYVKSIAIDGQWYAGNIPNNYKGPSPIRLISDIGPVKGATNPDIVCGLSAQKAEMVVPANPGSVFSVQWSGGDGVSKWPHNIGPLMTYMASCGSTACTDFDPSGAKWFKIDELGLKPDGSGDWFQNDIMTAGDAFDVTLPQDLAPGGYLVRHEIIALHLATEMGGAEFYPMCTQVMIQGSGNGVPAPTVAFPGAYSDSDPGIFDPDVFNAGANYTFPGGPVANLAGTDASMAAPFTGPTVFPSGTSVAPLPAPTGASSGNTTAPSSPSDSAPSAPEPTASPSDAGAADPAATGATRGSTCHLRARGASSAGTHERRHFKRFLRTFSR
ncbi:glycoside hydrolase family 61 protein [Phanerochaete sordida]|uniref:lytic cellulose monooxygenase (C4-dehydrogenating) n=1 Tax=Phanerochaete sordida TaxID=48140 RepID=A0A9P3LBP8_9APHY|nr:glycoside hydrolase family 61 protein [Phanerochaete sordida]